MRVREKAVRPPRGLYLHIPFCDGKCPYCAFYSVRAEAARIDRYLAALERECAEWRRRLPEFRPRTIYWGGGTPSLLPAPALDRLLRMFQTAGLTAEVEEWTVEMNPAGATADRLRRLREAGVNRISLGAQSFDEAILRRLGRRHSVAEVLAACAEIRRAGFRNWGLDLIACVPGVTVGRWTRVLQAAVAQRPAHLSVYALTVEEGSRLPALWRRRGERPMDERMELRHLDRAHRVLAASGYERYEISNYARPGRACRHNRDCWEGADYLGWGPAAASRLGLRRWTAAPDWEAYCEAWLAGRQPPGESDDRSPAGAAQDDLVFGLRMTRGVRLGALVRRHGLDRACAVRWRATAIRLARLGLMERRGAYWRLTARGRNVADAVAVEFME